MKKYSASVGRNQYCAVLTNVYKRALTPYLMTADPYTAPNLAPLVAGSSPMKTAPRRLALCWASQSGN